MKKYTQETMNELPFHPQEIFNVIENIVTENNGLEIKPDTSMQTEHLMYKKDSENLQDGFYIHLMMQKNDAGDLDVYIKELIIYENPDEWLDAFNWFKLRKRNTSHLE